MGRFYALFRDLGEWRLYLHHVFHSHPGHCHPAGLLMKMEHGRSCEKFLQARIRSGIKHFYPQNSCMGSKGSSYGPRKQRKQIIVSMGSRENKFW